MMSEPRWRHKKNEYVSCHGGMEMQHGNMQTTEPVESKIAPKMMQQKNPYSKNASAPVHYPTVDNIDKEVNESITNVESSMIQSKLNFNDKHDPEDIYGHVNIAADALGINRLSKYDIDIFSDQNRTAMETIGSSILVYYPVRINPSKLSGRHNLKIPMHHNVKMKYAILFAIDDLGGRFKGMDPYLYKKIIRRAKNMKLMYDGARIKWRDSKYPGDIDIRIPNVVSQTPEFWGGRDITCLCTKGTNTKEKDLPAKIKCSSMNNRDIFWSTTPYSEIESKFQDFKNDHKFVYVDCEIGTMLHEFILTENPNNLAKAFDPSGEFFDRQYGRAKLVNQEAEALKATVQNKIESSKLDLSDGTIILENLGFGNTLEPWDYGMSKVKANANYNVVVGVEYYNFMFK